MECKFQDKCSSFGVECDFCQYNPNACMQNYFEWDGTGEEPTEKELDEAIMS